uniref:FAD-binding domain-containing protein n=1 Tax=Ditylenchus dipsaci TaxID=166011 RepID=A0A915E1B6_9BILA
MLGIIYYEHKTNRPTAAASLKTAVIVGGGPSGLYTTLQLFKAGMHVTLVNNRQEYVRNKFIRQNNYYVFLLRIFSGTQFDELLLKNQFSGFTSTNNLTKDILVNLKDLKEAMKNLLQALI